MSVLIEYYIDNSIGRYISKKFTYLSLLKLKLLGR
jgi:hypothetical protein